MPEAPVFNSPEEEIKYLEQKILEKQKELEGRSHREVIKETLKEHTKYITPSTPPSQTQPALQDDTEMERDVAYLVQLAFGEGIVAATKRAKSTHNPYLIDAFHDALVDRFLEELKSRGILDAAT